jgi:hypothetical protein
MCSSIKKYLYVQVWVECLSKIMCNKKSCVHCSMLARPFKQIGVQVGWGGGGGNKLQSPMVHKPGGGGAISLGARFCIINMVPELYIYLI